MTDQYWMNKAFEMSLFTEDRTSYKKVGCVIVKDGIIVGRGYRKTVIFHNLPYRDITFHSEHIALMEAKEMAKGSTLYNTMEPCNHRIYGDWNALELPSSCSELIVKYGVVRVVFSEADEVHGGSLFLKSNNIIVDKI